MTGCECFGVLSRHINGRLCRDIAGRMAPHPIGYDPKVAAINGGEGVLIRLAHMPGFRSPEAEPSGFRLHSSTASLGWGGPSPTYGGLDRTIIHSQGNRAKFSGFVLAALPKNVTSR